MTAMLNPLDLPKRDWFCRCGNILFQVALPTECNRCGRDEWRLLYG